jgi:sugar/nucleoside kinase (ribokinase family)
MRTLLLGEALVDLVCEHPAASLAQATAFVPHFGGAPANVAVTAARAGAAVALAGGVGDDGWGAWLAERLHAEGVDLSFFARVPGLRTPVSFVTVDAAGEPAFLFHPEGLDAIVAGLAERIDAAVEACDALFLALSLLTGPAQLAVAMRARERALELGRPVVMDPNLRLDRWADPAQAADAARAAARGAFLVKCNRAEARLLTGERDPAHAAEALLAGGARHAVVTLGAGGALLRGPGLRADVPGVPATVLDATGAGDAVSGVLLARLALAGFDPAVLPPALEAAVAEGARATERWGAVA